MFTDKNSFKEAYLNKFIKTYGKPLEEGSIQEKYDVLARLVRDYLTDCWYETNQYYKSKK